MCGLMTLLAPRLFPHAELAAVHVLMTIDAAQMQRPIARDLVCGEIGEDRQTHARPHLRF